MFAAFVSILYTLLAVPDPALLGFDHFPIYYLLIIAIPDSSLVYTIK